MNKGFCLTLLSTVGLFLLGFSSWVSAETASTFSEARVVAQYNYIIHILAMLLVGFGFLMVFVRRYGFGAVTGTYGNAEALASIARVQQEALGLALHSITCKRYFWSPAIPAYTGCAAICRAIGCCCPHCHGRCFRAFARFSICTAGASGGSTLFIK